MQYSRKHQININKIYITFFVCKQAVYLSKMCGSNHPFLKDSNDLKIYQMLLFAAFIVNQCFEMAFLTIIVCKRSACWILE